MAVAFEMHFTIERERFVQDVQHVVKAVSSRTTIPILTGLKIVANSDGITLTGSDSDISIETFIPLEEEGEQIASIHEQGSIVLQAHFFCRYSQKAAWERNGACYSRSICCNDPSGSSVFNLNGYDPEEYPRLPQLEENMMFRLQQNMLKNMIQQTVFAVSTQETRPVLTGVNLELNDDGLVCTATDSHRLAMRKATIEQNNEELAFSNVVIPGKSLNELNKILEDTTDEVEIVVTDNQVLFKLDNLLFFFQTVGREIPSH